MLIVLLRTLILYFSLILFLRLMGKRQVGELDISELVSALLLSEIVAMPIENAEIPLLSALIPMLTRNHTFFLGDQIKSHQTHTHRFTKHSNKKRRARYRGAVKFTNVGRGADERAEAQGDRRYKRGILRYA